jgi:hypothetical protein
MAAGHDQHPGGDQLITCVRRRPGISISRLDPGNLGEDVVAAVGHLAELGDP